jgi:molecular chaperone GrpE (heat shock protein)
VAYLILWQSRLPLDPWEMVTLAVCVALGALSGLLPFFLEYRAATCVAEADRLRAAVLQVQNIEIIGRQIANATAHWQQVNEATHQTAESARQINEAAANTARSFSEFIQKANDTEKSHLRLEVEKLRRAENDWLQILVRILDHIFALYQAGVRSGQANLAEQLGNFQNACRDAARRVGLTVFAAAAGDLFDPEIHQVSDSQPAPVAGSRVAETLATGYSFQGQLVRPALVALQRLEVRKQPDDSDLSVSMISRRHGSSHVVEESPASPPTAEETTAIGANGPAVESVTAEKVAPKAPPEPGAQDLPDADQEQLRL